MHSSRPSHRPENPDRSVALTFGSESTMRQFETISYLCAPECAHVALKTTSYLCAPDGRISL
jgi:hypothetical protein